MHFICDVVGRAKVRLRTRAASLGKPVRPGGSVGRWPASWAFNTNAYTPYLDAGDGGLGDAARLGKLGLGETLQLANDADRFTRRYVHTPFLPE